MTRILACLLSPLLLGVTLLLFFGAQAHGWNLATVFAWMSGGRILLLLLLERCFPAQPEWQMTWASFRRDLKYMAVNGGVAGLLKVLPAWVALDMSRWNTGVVVDLPVWVELLMLVLTYEFFQYWYHRFSHEGRGRWGAWLWRTHVAHHLPDRVYLLMHPVGHPLNLLISLALVQWPLVVLGVRPETVFLFNALMSLQGLLSHFNVDVRAGWMNYLLVGTELHRHHHSADMQEAQNYGVLTPFWDLVFGTFVYTPGQLPGRLGVADPAHYPDSADLARVLALPWQGGDPVESEPRPVQGGMPPPS
ncbi:sterol desaturase family protein [uncultured Rhodoferax sp.]|uniref:sterol desaturase family protein n=1 Tax=uncultured Rhodoferax sp. TaxID=223188 RepID=UPI0025DC3305|nr:sterol desaturase family protein [uncultured Rhodoferax sp.]